MPESKDFENRFNDEPIRSKTQIGVVGVLFWVASIAAVGFGVLSLTEATWGVGLIAGGCYLGILSRIAQASYIANIDR